MGGEESAQLDEHMHFKEFRALNDDMFSKAQALAPTQLDQFQQVDPSLKIIPDCIYLPRLSYYYKGTYKEFEGQIVPQGIGYIYCEEYFYRGTIKQGVPEIDGYYYYSNNLYYYGEIQKGLRHGKGTLTEANNKNYYIGIWAEGLKDGYGFQKNQNGSCYEGTFSKDEMVQGILYHYNKRIMSFSSDQPQLLLSYLKNHPFCEQYKGKFKNGVYDGHGEYIWQDGKRYVGQWLNGSMHGKGEFFWPDGKYYYGEYFQDEKQGYGIMIWSKEKYFEGKFDKGKPNGFGLLNQYNKKNGSYVVKNGVWVDGAFMKNIKDVYTASQIQKIKHSFVLARAKKYFNVETDLAY